MTPPLRVSVTALIADAWPTLFGIAGPFARERLALGNAVHADWQASQAAADASFEREVRLEAVLAQGGRTIELFGRADGVREAADGTLELDEVKGHDPESEPGRARRAAARRQVRLYGWMLARRDARPVRARVVWIPFSAEAKPRIEPVALDPAEVERWLERALARRIEAARIRERELEARQRAVAAIRFPHARRRAGQEEIGEAVLRCVERGEQLLIEAPTGLGKTAAVLHAALTSALGLGLGVHFATSRSAQRAGVIATHARLGLGAEAPAVRLAPQKALCLNEVVLCHEDHCRFAAGHARALAHGDAIGALLREGACDAPERLRERAAKMPACPWALARQAAERAALVVGDHNHVIGAGALAAFGFEGDPGEQVVVLDEAHQLPERAREEASASLELACLEHAAEALRFRGASVHAPVAEAIAALARWLEEAAHEIAGPEADFAAPWQPDAAALDARAAALDRAFAPWLRHHLALGDFPPDEPVRVVFQAVAALRRTLAARDVEIVPFLERREGALRLVAFCPDPTPRLRALFARCHAVIALSATLSPLAWRRDQLGFDPARCGELRLGSPFPPEQRCIVIDAGVDTRLRSRPRQVPRIAQRLAALADAVPGHTLALLPSHGFAAAVAAALPPDAAARLILQRAEPSPTERSGWLAALRSPAEARHLVLGVAGGTLAEGVDFAGGGLRAVAVVGPCLPPADAERELLRAHLDERGDPGFELAYALPGMTRVVQSAGRLLRSERDRGVIALYGRRFLDAPFRELLPEAWLDGCEPEARVGDPAEVASGFFGSTSPAASA